MKIECDCTSCGYVFEVEKEEIRAKGRTTCPKCGYEHCIPDKLKRNVWTDRESPVGLHGRRPDNNSFWPIH